MRCVALTLSEAVKLAKSPKSTLHSNLPLQLPQATRDIRKNEQHIGVVYQNTLGMMVQPLRFESPRI